LSIINPIGCTDEYPSELCVDESMRECRRGPNKCQFCYCRDHRYKSK